MVVCCMPWANVEDKRKAQNAWRAKRRADWFAENGPCVDCGSWEDLRLDHVDASTKVDHRVFSWSEARRLLELAKCVVRCQPCHVIKTRFHKENAKGSQISSVLTEAVVHEARELYSTKQFTWPQLGERFNVKHNTLRRACKDFWKHVE